MPIQDFNIYTGKGYEGQLCDSGPRVVQTGVVASGTIGFGKAVKPDYTIDRGIVIGTNDSASDTNVWGITIRDLNHEALTRPSDGDDFHYVTTDSASCMRQGFIYLKVNQYAAAAGDRVRIANDGTFCGYDGTTESIPPSLNVTWIEAGAVGEITKARIDIM